MSTFDRSKYLNNKIPVQDQDAKFRELIIHVASKCQDDPGFGAVKLNKILFYADFRAYKQWGRPITGVPYQRLPQGPAPTYMVQVLRDLHMSESVKTQIRMVGGKQQKRSIALRPADLTKFTAPETNLVDDVIRELWGMTATAVSVQSHGIQWSSRNDRDPMPYESALLSEDPLTPDDVNRAYELAKQFGIKPNVSFNS